MAKLSILLLCVLALALVAGSHARREPSHKKTVGIYEIKKGNFSVKVTNFGATILSVVMPDSKGELADVVLGYDKISSYVNNTFYFGALIGRVANRIGGSRFVLNGTAYHLYPNDGKNSLHGGHRGYGQVIWTVKEKFDCDTPYITFYYPGFDKEQGFPGALDVTVTYKITGPYELSVFMSAKALNKATPVNLAQHSYWNLGGHNSGTILNNSVQIFGSHITPVDKDLIPTGEITPINGTAFDFLEPKVVGSSIEQVEGGYDINYVLDGELNCNGVRKAALVRDSRSGRLLELWTNQPGLQFYTGNFLDGVKGKAGAVYPQNGALCLETQGFPDSVNHPNFPSQIVNPGEEYKHIMQYKFSF